MEYSMVLSDKTAEKLFYKYGVSQDNLDGVIVIDRETITPSIQKKSENTPMRFSTLGKLLKAIFEGEEPLKYHFAS